MLIVAAVNQIQTSSHQQRHRYGETASNRVVAQGVAYLRC